MIAEKKHLFEQRMQALHDKYCQRLPEKLFEIESCWSEYQTDFSQPEVFDTFYRLIHTLKGTAATFGFNTQADICYEIQKILLKTKETHTALAQNDAQQIQKHLNALKTNINAPADFTLK